MYQDIWLNGKMIKKGTRNCADRYEIIRSFCYDRFHEPFTVCDIGANMCYFSLRLIEDFGCNVMAFEFHRFDLRLKHVGLNNVKQLMLFDKKISCYDLDTLNSCCHFDLVLALSVVHHLPGDKYEWIKKAQRLGDNFIAEFALSDSKRVKDFEIPEGGDLLGYGDSHLSNEIKRPIIHYATGNRSSTY